MNCLNMLNSFSGIEEIKQNLPEGLLNALIGFVAVFLILTILILLILVIRWLVPLINKASDRFSKKSKEFSKNENLDETENPSNEVVAVIMAAINACYDGQPNVDFVVRKIKRIK